MTYYSAAERAAYRDFVAGLVNEAVRATRAAGQECTAQNLLEHVSWDSELLDAMIAERVFEVTA